MKKLGIIILVVVLALGAIGAAYAAWSQTLNITGAVNTASFDVHFDATPTGTAADSAGASVVVSNITTTGFTVTLNNAYPGYSGDCEYTIHNYSSIPVKINSFQYKVGSGSWTNWDGSAVDVIGTASSEPIYVTAANTGVTSGATLTPTTGTATGTLTFTAAGTSTTTVAAQSSVVFDVKFVAGQ